MRARLRLFPFVLLAAACGGGDEHYIDAPTGIDGRQDAGSDLPAVEFPASLALGAGDCGATATATFDAENTGGGDLDYAITSSSAVFTVTPASGTIIAGTTTQFTVTAAVPADATPGTPVTGELTITSAALDEPLVVPVSVDPRGGVVVLEPAAANFGDVQLGATGTQTISVSNTGNAPVSVSIAAPDDAEFGVAFTAGELAAAASRDATVTYTPGELGADTATSAITVTGATCAPPPSTLAMSASGIPTGGVAVTGNLAFGTQACGAASGTATVTLENHGPAPATWTAAFLADAENDGARYQLSATSGTIAAGATETVTVTRLAIPLPATPRAYDATLRVTTVGLSTVNHDLPVSQTLQGAFLTASTGSLDFGYAPTGTTLTRAVTVTNTGNASATATFTETGTHFAVPQSGGTIASGGGTAAFDASYAPTALGTTSGSVTVSAPGACSSPVTVSLAAGDGPWTEWSISTVGGRCDQGTYSDGYLDFYNPGTQDLTLSNCTETTSAGVVASLTPMPATAGSGYGSGYVTVDWNLPAPLRAGTTTTTIRCDTNEKFYTQRTITLTRTMTGADLAITQPDGAFTFVCGDPPSFRRVRIVNSGNEGVDLYPYANTYDPLYHVTDYVFIDPGATVESGGVGLGSGSGWCGFGSGDYSGYYDVGVAFGSANLCSVTGATTFDVLLDAP